MTTEDLIEELKKHPGKTVVFWYDSANTFASYTGLPETMRMVRMKDDSWADEDDTEWLGPDVIWEEVVVL